MINDRKMIICDCCGRQIVSYAINSKLSIGPRSQGILMIGINKHACWECAPEEIAWNKIQERKYESLD